MYKEQIAAATAHFAQILEQQLKRVERMKQEDTFIDFQELPRIVIGIVGGDGIGPYIAAQTQRILEQLLANEIRAGKVELRTIDGLTIENRIAHMESIPKAVLEELRQCHVVLKGPTTTPDQSADMPNIESANVSMRREFDLFANIRPVRVPELNIDWMFFRENTEGEYVLGSQGFDVTPDLAVDFKVTTTQGSERIIRAAFEYAKKHGKKRVTVVTKANVVKTTDGKFLSIAKQIAAEYPEITCDDWYIDIMTAKLIDPSRRSDFEVLVMPNLYGDILTDEAAQIQGGVGTAGSANIGTKYAMFEAIHGSAPRMVAEGRAQYADPSSLIKAAVMMLEHIGYNEQGEQLQMALDICSQFERKVKLTGRSDGATNEAYTDYILATLENPQLADVYQRYLAEAVSKTDLA
ncbi:MAG: isocitrate/isopropylmalate dehydrogenase family protein [Firmicutes bacterium]|jgi:isocitrate dehydrogenase (NAD+)|nr:isocitrate/isopropylmalate dehydrogenase family protein [Bacillota bacterium]